MPPWACTHRAATTDDVAGLVDLAHAHYGGDPDVWRARLGAAVDGGERVLVAEQDGLVVAYARVGSRRPTGPDDPAPGGTWLTGTVVHPAHRRRGHARRLHGLLLAEVLPDGDPVWSMANARNDASLALHSSLGFVEVLRAPRMLGQDFTGGLGVLLRIGPDRR